jgi:hypothetical protein
MGEHGGIPLTTLQQDPNLDFIKQFSKLFNDDNEINDSPYGDSDLSCNYLDEDQFINKFKKSDKNVIMSINVQSLHAKFTELSEFVYSLSKNDCNPCILALQELWTIHDPDLFKLTGYQRLIFKCRDNNVQGGGIGFFVANGLKVKIRSDLSIFVDKVYESLFIKIYLLRSKNITMGTIYRPNSNYVISLVANN